MPPRLACVAVLFTSACGAPAQPSSATKAPNAAGALGAEPAQFAWKAPLTVHVSEDATKNGNDASVSYWLDVCPKPPDQLTVAHRDFRFVTLMGKPASSPEFAPALAALTPLMSAIPRFVIDARGHIVSVEGVPDLIARLRATSPSAGLDQLAQTLENPAAAQAINDSAAERWQVWVQAWLTVDPHSITPQNILAPHRVKLTQSSQLKDIPDPNGSGAKLDLDLELTTDTEWPAIRPFTATFRKTARITVNGTKETHSETHRYRFDWDANPNAVPECSK